MIAENRDLIMFEKCLVCGGDEIRRLPEDWVYQVINMRKAIPIVGCGNPWHYSGLAVGRGEAVRG